jgi:cytochrome c553
MKALTWILTLALLPATAAAAERPEWAFGPTTPPPQQPPLGEPDKALTVPGSGKTYTVKQIEDAWNPPDWFPDEHPQMPPVVSNGRQPAVRVCVTCHVGNGHGHPENSRLPGSTASYLARQLADFRSDTRKSGGNMIAIAKGMTPDEIKAATDYFAQLKTVSWTKVVEADTVPKTALGRGNRRIVDPNGGTEPLGNRIIEVPEDTTRVDMRDPHAGFVAYVPKGSLLRGAELVTSGGNGKTVACTICHGANLKGIGDVPGLAGRSPLNTARQLYHFQTGERGGPWAALMKLPVEKLSVDDILAIWAYVASVAP